MISKYFPREKKITLETVRITDKKNKKTYCIVGTKYAEVMENNTLNTKGYTMTSNYDPVELILLTHMKNFF